MNKPNFRKLWDAFPDHIKYPTLGDLYTALGGAAARNIHAPGFGANGNACATRISVALNKCGVPINQAHATASLARTVSTADGSKVIFGVADLRRYLVKTLGTPSIDNTPPFDDAFRKRRGIVAFSVNWRGASGHIALWDGSVYREPAHDNYAAYINSADPRIRTSRGEFWELA